MSIHKLMSFALFLGLAQAEQLTDKVELNGQIRSRLSYTKKDPSATINKGTSLGELRTRLGLTVSPSETVKMKIEFQDSRILGGETPAASVAPHTSSLSNDGNLDLHQAYIDFKLLGLQNRLGRQKFKIGSQRLVSSLEWHANARVFDGITKTLKSKNNTLTAWGFWVHNAGKEEKDGTFLLGLHDEFKLTKDINVEAYAMYDKSQVGGVKTTEWDLVYLGERVSSPKGKLTFEEEIIVQLGKITPLNAEEQNSLAFQAALRIAFNPSKATSIGIGHELMSGDDDTSDKTFKTYMNNYSFAHAYFGFMDYVLVNRAHTANKGIQDFRLDLKQSFGKNTTFKLSFHEFYSAKDDLSERYGHEIDFEAHLKLFPKSKWIIGAAAFMTGDESQFISGKGKGTDYYFYFMPIFNF